MILEIIFSFIAMQLTCIEDLTCLPEAGDSPLQVLELYSIQYGLPNEATLGLILGIFVAVIYVKTRSLTMLAILGVYVLGIVAATWAADPYVAAQYETIKIIVVVAIAVAGMIVLLKTFREW